jgi:hypothetical protein
LVYDSESQATIAASRLTAEDVDAVARVDGVAAAAPITVLTNGVVFQGEEVAISRWAVASSAMPDRSEDPRLR